MIKIYEEDINNMSKREMDQELQWVKYRIKMLDLMDIKLQRMKELAQKAEICNFDENEVMELNKQIQTLASHVRALDQESKRSEDTQNYLHSLKKSQQ